MPLKKPVSLCLHAIDDVGDNESIVTMSVISIPLTRAEDPDPEALPFKCAYTYYETDDIPIKTTIDNYVYETVYERFKIPLASWNHGNTIYYIATAFSAAPTAPIYCPTFICRSDNGAVIVIEDELPFIDELDTSDYDAHVFTNVQPNAQGCVTLGISMPIAPIANLWARVYYYTPNVSGLEYSVLSQLFPVYHITENRYRIGFKAFISPENNSYTTDVLPMVWVNFLVIPPDESVSSAHV